jgi:hypothetical protein
LIEHWSILLLNYQEDEDKSSKNTKKQWGWFRVRSTPGKNVPKGKKRKKGVIM